jgi:serine/threonine protein kinase
VHSPLCLPTQVAIKTLKQRCASLAALGHMPEVRALRALSHPNIVDCYECVLDSGVVHLVFELMPDGDLESLCRESNALLDHHITAIAYQLLAAVDHIHASSFLHRDIKPENVLLSFPQPRLPNSVPHVKLGDLGLAKHTAPDPRPAARPHTTYVATRWYRAPEQLLRMASYGPAADMWSVGATLAELVTRGEPLFPGDDEPDTLAAVFELRGHPAVVGWPAGAAAAARVAPTAPLLRPSSLAQVLRTASPPVLKLIDDLLQLDPRGRPSAAAAMQYPMFRVHRARAAPRPGARATTAALSSRGDTHLTGAGLALEPGYFTPTRDRALDSVVYATPPPAVTPRSTAHTPERLVLRRRPPTDLSVPPALHVVNGRLAHRAPLGTFFDIPTARGDQARGTSTPPPRPLRSPAGFFHVRRPEQPHGHKRRRRRRQSSPPPQPLPTTNACDEA